MRLDVLRLALPLLLASAPAGKTAAPADSGRAERPRILLSEDLKAAARKAGFASESLRVGIYRVGTDGAETSSLLAPELIGDGKVHLLRMDATGVLRVDTLAAETVRWIEVPAGGGGAELFMGFGFAGLLPLALTQSAIYGVAGVGALSLLTLNTPEFALYPGLDFFRKGPYLRGAAALTVEGATRNAFNEEDRRQEVVTAWNLDAEVGSPLSALSISLSARLAQMKHRWTTERLDFPKPDEHDFNSNDSLYALGGTGIAISPSVKIMLMETRRAALFTQLGGYWAWLPGTRLRATTGAELGAGLDLWLIGNLGFRTEAALMLPMGNSSQSPACPSVGAGLAYRFGPQPQPSYQPAVFISLLDMFPTQGLSPEVSIEVEDGKHQSMGFRIWDLREQWNDMRVYDSVTSSENRGSSSRLGCEAQYGFHTDRAERFYGGALISLGVVGKHLKEYHRYQSPYYPNEYSNLDNGSDLSFAAGVEAGLRLAAGFGLRAQWRMATTTSTHQRGTVPFSAGLTYRIPGQRERK
jgi:hypothetical protein